MFENHDNTFEQSGTPTRDTDALPIISSRRVAAYVTTPGAHRRARRKNAWSVAPARLQLHRSIGEMKKPPTRRPTALTFIAEISDGANVLSFFTLFAWGYVELDGLTLFE